MLVYFICVFTLCVIFKIFKFILFQFYICVYMFVCLEHDFYNNNSILLQHHSVCLLVTCVVTSWLRVVAYMGGTSVAMPIPTASAGRVHRLSSGGSISSCYSQSPGGASSLPGQSLTSLFPKPDTQPSEVNC